MATIGVDDLIEAVYRDLADLAHQVFDYTQVYDFVCGGIADLNRVAPLDIVETLELNVGEDGTVYDNVILTSIHLPYRVEVIHHETGAIRSISEPEDGWVPVNGYDFKRATEGGRFEFPPWFLARFADSTHGIRVHGYATRPMPHMGGGEATGGDIDLSVEEQDSVRLYARSAGFDLLAHDRSLFAQWQGQTNNTDVSPTQMMQMSQGAKQEWDHHRGLIRTVRKYW